VMAYAMQVSSSSVALPFRLSRSCTPTLQTGFHQRTHSKAQCCFSSQNYMSIPTQMRTIVALCAQGRRPYKSTSQQPRQSSRMSRDPSPSQQNRQYAAKRMGPRLERPEVLFSNNHVLVVNKPAGWKSQPGDGGGKSNNNMQGTPDPKCLLTYLKSQSLGGGSQKDFLMPTHRLDQPCTGALIFAKNGKAASRVQVAWSKRKVKKCYWVVVEGGDIDRGERVAKIDGLELLRSRSIPSSKPNAKTYRLSAILKSTGNNNSRKGRGGRPNNVRSSVEVKPIPPNLSASEIADSTNGRVCHIEWEHLLKLPSNSASSSTRHLLSVTTDTGAKHQVRALLALAGGAPIAGDLRYGNKRNNSQQGRFRGGRVDQPLPDGSVALHARSVFLPTVSLGGMEFLKDKPFVASIPKRWRNFFGVCEDDVRELW